MKWVILVITTSFFTGEIKTIKELEGIDFTTKEECETVVRDAIDETRIVTVSYSCKEITND